MDVVWLGEPSSAEVGLVGGKTANLGRLASMHRVPPGFCITTRAFLAATRTQAEPYPDLPALAAGTRDELADAYDMLARRVGVADPSVAVRSSAADEDGEQASFAGQHETYLNVSGADAVASAVQRCWASAGASRAIEYRRRQNLRDDGVRLAVLVQHLVPADVSAVAFSANPLTGCRDEVVINASWGLGESIVGGTVTPDTYVLRKPDLAVTSVQIAEKRRMTVPVPEGTREVDVPRLLRSRRALTDEQAAEIGALARSLEATMGWPVDVECAFRDGTLFLLQCRPVTTLSAARV